MVWLIVLCILYDEAQTYAEEVVLRSSRRGSTVSRSNFSCEVREIHVFHVVNVTMFAKISGGGQLPSLPVPGCGPEAVNISFLSVFDM